MPPEEIYEPTVSVIVPVINAEKTIRPLLDSLTEIDYDKRKVEIIIVDGGSKDRTRDIVQQYPVKLVLEERRGLNVARNIGVKRSSGAIVLFTDSDCAVPKDWIRTTVKNFMDPEVGCVGGSVLRYEDTFLSIYADESFMPVLRRFRDREVLDNVGLLWRYPAGCNMAFRRTAIEKVNWFDEDVHYGFDEDELVERVCNAGYKMVLDP
ncbi:MAG: glycosyltransferase, partial [Nitrososphaerota archaeon]